jgi:hypothetical protein
MLRATMPETTVNENGKTLGAENEIGMAPKRLMPPPARNVGGAQNGDKF